MSALQRDPASLGLLHTIVGTTVALGSYVDATTDSGGRQRTRTDDVPQARRAAALAVHAVTWHREEANARNWRG